MQESGGKKEHGLSAKQFENSQKKGCHFAYLILK
jgi:hypothetical protein